MLADPVLAIAAKFIEQGGLWVVLAFIVVLLALAVWSVRRLFDAYEKVQEARVSETQEIANKAIAAVEAARISTEATTRAIEVNANVSAANKMTIEARKMSVDALARAITTLSEGRRR